MGYNVDIDIRHSDIRLQYIITIYKYFQLDYNYYNYIW